MKTVGKIGGSGRQKYLQPGYPKISSEEDNLTVTELYVMNAAEMRKLPKRGDEYEGEMPLPNDVGKLVLLRIGAEPKATGGPWTVTLEYGPEPLYDEVSGTGRNQVRKTYEMSTEDMDVPLEQHKDYRTCWNHVLLAKTGLNAVPEWWGEATDTVIDGDDYKWGKPGETSKEGWHVVKAETMPGIESWRSGAVTVTVTKTCRSREGFDREAKKQDYTIGKPGKTFGVTGKWLRGGSSIRREGRRWVMTVAYINCKRYQEELYEAENAE